MRRKLPKTACTLMLLFLSKGNTILGVPYQTFTGLFTLGPVVLRQRRTGFPNDTVAQFLSALYNFLIFLWLKFMQS